MGTKTRKNSFKGGSTKKHRTKKHRTKKYKKSRKPTFKSKVLNYKEDNEDIEKRMIDNFNERFNRYIAKYNSLLKEIKKRKIEGFESYVEIDKEIQYKKFTDETLGKKINFLMELFINDYLQLSREYKRKHSMNKKYIYEEAMFFEIVIFLILSKYIIEYNENMKNMIILLKKIKKLQESLFGHGDKTPEEEYEKETGVLFKLRESDIVELKTARILRPIEQTNYIDQYFSKLYKNYLLKGTNNHSLLLLHMKEKYDKTKHSLDEATKLGYDHILEFGPKMNEYILYFVSHLKKNTNENNNNSNIGDITRYNSFKDFIKQKKKKIKKQQKNFEVHEKKLKEVIKILDPNDSSNSDSAQNVTINNLKANNNGNDFFNENFDPNEGKDNHKRIEVEVNHDHHFDTENSDNEQSNLNDYKTDSDNNGNNITTLRNRYLTRTRKRRMNM